MQQPNISNLKCRKLADVRRSEYSMEIKLELSKSFFIRGDTLKSTSYPMLGIKQLDINSQQLPPISCVRL